MKRLRGDADICSEKKVTKSMRFLRIFKIGKKKVKDRNGHGSKLQKQNVLLLQQEDTLNNDQLQEKRLVMETSKNDPKWDPESPTDAQTPSVATNWKKFQRREEKCLVRSKCSVSTSKMLWNKRNTSKGNPMTSRFLIGNQEAQENQDLKWRWSDYV